MSPNDADRTGITGDGSGTVEELRETGNGALEGNTFWLEREDTGQVTQRLDVSNIRLFENRWEVIIELHGWTADGEFGVISYVFTPNPNANGQLRSPEIPSAHEEIVHEALNETGHTLA